MFGDFFMFNKDNWQMPYLKNDLKNVIINGLSFALLGGILAGSLDFLFNYITHL